MRKTFYLIIISLVLLTSGIHAYKRFYLPKKIYDKLSNSDIYNIYGWNFAPRNDKPNTSYRVSYFDQKTANINNIRGNADSSTTYINIINNKIDTTKYNYEITHISQLMQFNNKEVVDSIMRILNEIHALKIKRARSDLLNKGVVSFTFGSKEQIVFMYIPSNLKLLDRDRYLHGYKKIDTNWYRYLR